MQSKHDKTKTKDNILLILASFKYFNLLQKRKKQIMKF